MNGNVCVEQEVLERRRDRRLKLNFPVQCFSVDQRKLLERTVTSDISSAGVQFESSAEHFEPGSQVRLVFTIPPGEGHMSASTELTATAQVLRVCSSNENGEKSRVSAKFTQPLRFVFQS